MAGLRNRGLMRQDQAGEMEQQDAQRKQQFEQAFNQAAQGEDVTTEDGYRNVLRKVVLQGFGKEAAQHYVENAGKFPQAKEKKLEIYKGEGQDYQYDPANPAGTMSPLPFKPATKDENPYDLKEGADRTYTPVNKKTGLDPNGKPVKAPPPMTAAWATPPAQAQVNNWAQGLADGSRSIDDVYKASTGIRGPNRQKFIDDAITGAQKINPDFSPTQAKIAFKEAENHSNQRTLGLIQGVLPNIQDLVKLSDKINRSGLKVVSHAELAANRAFSDQDVANFDKLKTITADEINQIFAGGQGGSETSRQMALGLIDQDLPPATFAKSLATVYQAMQNRKMGITSRMGQYGGAQSKDMGGSGSDSNIAQPKSKAERDALPAGTKYIGPDGKVAVKQ
jgi:hypothetical protein